MTFIDSYAKWCNTTAFYPKEKEVEYLALGLCSEAGEVASIVKKMVRDGFDNQEALQKELGDCFWYLVQMCNAFDIPPSDVIATNMNKLESRKARGVLGGSGDER